MSARGIVSAGSLSFGGGQSVWLQSTIALAAGTAALDLGATTRPSVAVCVPLSTMTGTLGWAYTNSSTITVSSTDNTDTTPVSATVWKQ